ncbi:MAG: hypothetical protein KAY62_00305 [Burkholderiaceae bacterium]|nr:hypothetical protein [Burkholderiaceae bacterium]
MQQRTKRRLVWVTASVALCVVMLVGLVGYTTPGMRLNWDSIAALCGF